MGGASLPTASTPGYGRYGNKVACDCLIAWLPWLKAVYLAKGLIKTDIDVWQLTGGAVASGGTHTKGGAYDLLYQTSPAHIAVAREMGARAWGRTKDQGFSEDHQHGALDGCPHNGPAAYQITACERGYNGLGQATSGTYAGQWGYGHKDEFPKPSAWRTWKQGIEWAKAEINRLQPPEEDPLAGITVDQIAKAVWEYAVPNHDANRDGKPDGSSLTRSNLVMANWRSSQVQGAVVSLAGQVAGLTKAVAQLASGQAVDLDAISAAAKAGAEAALSEKITDASVTLNVSQP